MPHHALLPRYPVPALNVPTVSGDRFVLGAIDFALAKDYPARGEYTGDV